MSETCWLPNLEFFSDYNAWDLYEDALYAIFKKDFIESRPSFKSQPVNIRKHPIEFGKEEAFFHITCQDYSKNSNRVPDFRRCERIRWARAFIENYMCDPTQCNDCDGIKIWREPFHSKERVHILFEEERYIVILEPRENYCLLITAFYLEWDHAIRKQLKNYQKYKN